MYEGMLYLFDSYLKSFDAAVTAIDSGVNDDIMVIMDRTAFYPTGGGQPCDTGVIVMPNGKSIRVLRVEKADDVIFHYVENPAGLASGDVIRGEIDWKRRYAHMKLHTAVHLIDAIVKRKHNGAFLTGGQIYDNRARFDVDWPELGRDMLPELEAETNQEALMGHAILVKFVKREEAKKIEGLARTKPGEELLNRLEVVRIVEIEGLDQQMDGGTHLNNTKEMGEVKFINYESKGKHNKRIEFTLASI